MKNFDACLRRQLQAHPSMLPQDVVKLCYQAACGAEHMLEDFAAAEAALERPHVRVKGLMTIPPADADRDTNMQYFRQVQALYVDINEKLFHNELECISMGMSGDFADAIRAGATMVRVGTAIFGTRYYT